MTRRRFPMRMAWHLDTQSYRVSMDTLRTGRRGDHIPYWSCVFGKALGKLCIGRRKAGEKEKELIYLRIRTQAVMSGAQKGDNLSTYVRNHS